MKANSLNPLRIVFSLIITIISLSPVFAQNNGKISGRVINKEGEPIELVSVGIQGSRTGNYTDEGGNFSLTVPVGKHIVHFSILGHKNKEVDVNVVANKTADLGDVELDVSDNVLNEVVVSAMITKFAQKKSDYVARMPISNLENPQVYTVVPKELLSEQIAVDFRNVLTASPGVGSATLGVGSGGTGLGMRLRGFAGADGAGSIRNGMATNFVSLSDPANLESIEIIKGPSGTLFGTTLISYGGLVNRVTKRAYDGQGGEVSFSAGAWD